MRTNELTKQSPNLSISREQGLEKITSGERLRPGEFHPVMLQQRRLEGWPLVALVLGAMMMVFSMIHYIVTQVTAAADRSANRAHELARVAIENAGPTIVQSSEAPLWVYVACLFAGTALILWITKGCPTV